MNEVRGVRKVVRRAQTTADVRTSTGGNQRAGEEVLGTTEDKQ
jgi:hypothetical protein